jgi:uncharacterized membrane protein YidH (DUF202 family)
MTTADGRTNLALIRSALAAERTLMAWIRTSLAMISFGFTMAKLGETLNSTKVDLGFRHATDVVGVGYFLVVLGTLALIVAAVQDRIEVADLVAQGLPRRSSLAFVIAVLLSSLGIFVFAAGLIVSVRGVMDDMWVRFATNMVGRVTGPMKFRLVLQPAMAVFFAIRYGLVDAKAGRPPYFWALLSGSAPRAAMIKDGWKHVGRVFVLAVVLDVVYQLYVLHFVYVGEAITVAIILAIVPYLIVRGLVTRLARAKFGVRA